MVYNLVLEGSTKTPNFGTVYSSFRTTSLWQSVVGLGIYNTKRGNDR